MKYITPKKFMPDISEYSEYTYESKRSFNHSEALNEYKRAIQRHHPDALIVLDDLGCGHWNVIVLQTSAEKDQYYRRRLSSFYKQATRPLRKK